MRRTPIYGVALAAILSARLSRFVGSNSEREFPVSYYFSKTLPVGFDEAVRRSIEGLKQEGFGIITEIDLKEIFKKKINVDFRNYRILSAVQSHAGP